MTTQMTPPPSAATAATAAGRGEDDPMVPMAPPPKLRRRPLLWALGVALIALGGLGAAWLVTATSDTQSVLAVRVNIDRGSTIEAEDLLRAQVSGDPALAPIPESQSDSVIGQTASRDLTAGSLVTADAFSSQVVPTKGDSLVGVALTTAQLPASGVRPGDAVRVVNTPRTQEDVPRGKPTTVPATVVTVREVTDAASVVVDVTVPKGSADRLAALVATGRVALVVDSVADTGGER